MRVCPKCGFVDPPEWRHSRYSYWIDFTFWDDFERMQPQISEKLKGSMGKKVVEDKDYLFKTDKSGTKVFRKAKVDYGYQWQIPMEKHTLHPIRQIQDFRKYWQLTDPKQKKLFEAKK